MVEAIYTKLLKKGLINKNCLVGQSKESILYCIAEVMGRSIKDCCYIGKCYPETPIPYESKLSAQYHSLFKIEKWCQFCIDEYRDKKGRQYFVRVNAKGETLYNSYPNYIIQEEGERVSTRLDYINFGDQSHEKSKVKKYPYIKWSSCPAYPLDSNYPHSQPSKCRGI